jgi:hypothetical protein
MSAEVLDLAGTWRFELDRANAGVAQRWPERLLAGRFVFPGTLPEREIGDAVEVNTRWTGGIFDRSWFTAPEYARYREPGHVKVPFWLQPETHYVGAAWFQRDFELPAAWTGRRVVLTLERPHWKTRVWLDGRDLGSNGALSVPHRYELGVGLPAGHHSLTIRVDNTLDPDIGENSHSVSDHTQGNWNGIAGGIRLEATTPTWVDDLQVFPRVNGRVAVVRGRIAVAPGQPQPAKIELTGGGVDGPEGPSREVGVAADGTFTAEYPFSDRAELWDEFSPRLQRVVASLPGGERRETRFGFREFRTEGRRLRINGRAIFLRGTLECAAFPRTGYPPLDEASWRKEFATIQAHGLNHVRFHSWCPPEAAFAVADELGLYLQIEVASWPNQSTTLGDGKPVDTWLDRETARIVREYGNHPSFVMLCAGNEPGGANYASWLAGWLHRQKAADDRRVYTAGAGWPELPENDYHVTPEPRIQHWGEGLASRINRFPPETRTDYADFVQSRSAPVVSHEIGQWCVYPNFGEMPKYTGYLKPRNFEIFRDRLEANGLGDQAQAFLIASGRLQTLCYKEDIESALRTEAMAGFQLLGLNDFPGQGTALVGVLDAFWEEKGYVSPAAFRRFCASTVPLARLAQRVFTSEEHLTAGIELAHFGPKPLPAVEAAWSLVSGDGVAVASGRLPKRDVPTGETVPLGRIDVPLRGVAAPAQYRLVVEVPGTEARNDWDLWIYPAASAVVAAAPASVHVTRDLDAAALRVLEEGGAVVLLVPPSRVAPDPARGPVALGFSSIFWNTAWTNGQPPHTLGILCDPRHPALAQFPTEAHSNWQWWYPVTNADAMILDRLPPQLHPVVQVIDDWVTNRRLALVFEARVGRGRLLVSSIELDAAVLDPVRRQLRASLLRYAAGEAFHPTTELTVEQVRSLLKP